MTRECGRHSEDTKYKTRQVEEPWLVKLKINIRREKHHPEILTSGIRLPRWLHYLFKQDTGFREAASKDIGHEKGRRERAGQ